VSENNWLCPRCKKRYRENIDGDWMWYCGPCNDRDYEHYRERKEWDYYHPPVASQMLPVPGDKGDCQS
jgi:hypothetical protein